MKYKIRGDNLQLVDIELSEGESVFTESGGMAWMSPNVEMDSNVRGGLMSGIGRMFSGESLFMINYKTQNGVGLISFASEFPGKIIPFKLVEGESIICQKDAFMVAEDSVELKVEFNKRIGAGFFGGEGFFLQKLTGPGLAFIEIAGEVTEYNLQEGQELKVNPGYIAAFEKSVDYDIVRVKGIKNILFSGEGLFLANLKGPGKVWLQSMPISSLAGKIMKYIPMKR